MQVKKKIVTLLAAAALASTATLATGAGTASADTFRDLGRELGTYTAFNGCEGWVHGGYDIDNSKVYARAEFHLPTSTRGIPCAGWLERRTSSTASWTIVSSVHYAPDTSTGWYYDGSPYQARVCVGDFLYSNSYSCIGYY